jgi:MoaA/NifB/PqqE/SkfB family radical SAM enzyme
VGARRNVLAANLGGPPVAGPYMAELDVTYRCNCRCKMCQRWRDSRTEGLTLADYQRLAGVFRDLGVYQVSIAGGEPLLRVRMTVSNVNVEELHDYFDKWAPVVDHVLIQPVHHCGNAFYTGNDREIFQLDTEKLMQQLKGHPLSREIYVKPLLKSLREKGTFPEIRCYAGVLMVRIDSWGKVYPCLEQHVCVGSVRETDFKTIWNSDSFDQARRRIFEDGTCSCWYNNTAVISHSAKLLSLTTARGLTNGMAGCGKKSEMD